MYTGTLLCIERSFAFTEINSDKAHDKRLHCWSYVTNLRKNLQNHALNASKPYHENWLICCFVLNISHTSRILRGDIEGHWMLLRPSQQTIGQDWNV